MKQNAKNIQVRVETSKNTFSPFGGITPLREAINTLGLDSHLDSTTDIGNTKAKQAISGPDSECISVYN